MFEPLAGGDDPHDKRIDDPSVAPDADDVPEDEPGLESTRLAWSNVAGHSHYLREECLKTWVATLKNTIAHDT